MVNESPRVSVVVPCFNHGRYLRQRLDSIFAQTFRDFEWIFLDDASTDDSRQVFDHYRYEARLAHVVFNERNSGNLFLQWNRGFRLARGEYVWIAESDDFSSPRFLEVLVERLDAHPRAAIAQSQSRMVGPDGAFLYDGTEHTRDIDQTRWSSDFVADGDLERREFLSRRNTIPNVSACLLRRSVAEAAGFAGTRRRFCEDWLLYVRMLHGHELAFVAEPLNFCRCHPTNTRSSNARTGEIEEFYAVLRELRKRWIPSESAEEFLAAHIYARWAELFAAAPRNFPVTRLGSLLVDGLRSDRRFFDRVKSSVLSRIRRRRSQ